MGTTPDGPNDVRLGVSLYTSGLRETAPKWDARRYEAPRTCDYEYTPDRDCEPFRAVMPCGSFAVMASLERGLDTVSPSNPRSTFLV